MGRSFPGTLGAEDAVVRDARYGMRVPRRDYPDTDHRHYEGLVISTTRLYADRLRVEAEDLEQLLRFRVWLALRSFNERRSQPRQPDAVRSPRETFVFLCVRNQIKDLTKSRMRKDSAMREVYLEDMAAPEAVQYRYEARHHAQVADRLDEVVVLPATLSPDERRVLALVYLDFSLAETARVLGIPARVVGQRMASVRQKMADWAPDRHEPGAQVVQLASEAWAVLEAVAA